jgi:hypothetical protein
MEGENVVIAFDKPTTAAVISPADVTGDDTVALVMPLRLSE